jgi:hypothetical protein
VKATSLRKASSRSPASVPRKFRNWANTRLKDCNRGLKAYARRQGGNTAPGQNPAPINVSGTTTLDPSEFGKNGNTPLSVITEEPESMIRGAPDCPNTNWTETIDDLLFTSASITVEQPEGTTVLVVNCTFDPPTSDDPGPKRSVTCTVPWGRRPATRDGTGWSPRAFSTGYAPLPLPSPSARDPMGTLPRWDAGGVIIG